ncbi:ribonuclease H-like domain-containing protein [Earliella scabrosa]|nr:ribonuclease H-like domain-containing protein [Earliella scabrosa]
MPKAAKPGFYAVARGRVPGVYTTWDECQQQVNGFMGNKHQKFPTMEQAQTYLAQHGVATPSTSASPAAAAPAASNGSVAAASNRLAQSRQHGAKPYSKPQANAADKPHSSGSSKWAALTTEVIEDESGWDVVYSDGACKGNGKAGSIAGVGVWWGPNDVRNVAERCPGGQTNNRAELIAIVRVLETAPHTKRPLLIKTDSKYSISCFREWMPKWLRNGFKSSTGQPVKNAPLIRYLSALLDLRAREGQKVPPPPLPLSSS